MAVAHRSTASVGSRGRPEGLSEEEFSERCGAESCLEQEHRHSDYTESHDDAKQSAVDVEDECVNGGGRGGGGERRSPESRRGCQGVRTRRYLEWAAATPARPPIFLLLLLLALMTPGGAGAQEAPRGWHRAQIGAGSQVISAQSLITVTLSPTVDLPIGTRITVRGLTGSMTQSTSSLRITGLNFAKFSDSGAEWQREQGVLILTAATMLDALCDATVSVTLSNPSSIVQGPSSMTASASYNGAQYIAESPVEGTVLTATFPPGWSGGVNGAETDVLFRESSNVRNMPNTLTLTFVPNAPFFPGSKITVIGVTGTQSQDRCENNLLCVNCTSASKMGGVAEWREPGTMVFTVDELQRIDPGEEVELCINVKNPAQPQQQCTAGEGDAQICRAKPISAVMEGRVIVAAGRSPVTVEATPVKGDVLSAATDYLLTGSIRENNTFAGARNVLYFDARANMFIQSGAEFVLMGLTGSGGCAATGAAVCTISLDGPFKAYVLGGTIAWDSSTGEGRFFTADDVQAGARIEFEFVVRNRDGSQVGVSPQIQILRLPGVPMRPASVSGTVLSSGTVPYMSVAKVKESTSTRNAYNSLQFTLNPTFDLDTGSGITITGLTGSQTPSGRLPISGVFVREYVEGRPAVKTSWPSAEFDAAAGVLVIALQHRLFSISRERWELCPDSCVSEFSVELLNARGANNHPQIMVSATLGWTQARISPTPVSNSDGVLRSASPFSFGLASASESTAIAGVTNVITIVLRPTGVIDTGTVLTVSGLFGSATPSTPSLAVGGASAAALTDCVASNCSAAACASLSGGACSVSSPAAAWSKEGGTLLLNVRRSLRDSTDYTFSFSLSNPPLPGGLPHRVPTLSAAGFPSKVMSISSGSADLRGLLSGGWRSSFTARTVSESNQINSAMNTVTFSIGTNFDIPAGLKISISNLPGTETDSSDALPIISPPPFLSPSIDYNATANSLIFTVTSTLAAPTSFSLSLLLRNPSQAASPTSSILIACDLEGGDRLIEQMAGSILSAGLDASLLPGTTIRESSNVPFATNQITITIIPEFEMSTSTVILITDVFESTPTLSGGFLPSDGVPLTGPSAYLFSNRSAPLLPLSSSIQGIPSNIILPPPSAPATPPWNNASLTLSLTPAATIPSGCPLTISFEILNPPPPSSSSPLSSYTATLMTAGDLWIRDFYIHNLTVARSSGINSFTMATAVPSTNVAGQTSVITLSFAANAELFSGQNITISGLFGAASPASGAIPLGGDNASSFLSTCVWDPINGTLVLFLASPIPANTRSSVKVTFVNSANATHGVVPNISVDGMLSAVMGGGGVLGGGGGCALTVREVKQEEGASVEGQRTTLIFRLASNCHAPFGSSLTVWPVPDGTALAAGFGYANVTVGETSTSAAVNLTDWALSVPVPVDWLPGMAYTAVVVLDAPPPQAHGQVLSVWMCDKSQTAVSNSSQNGSRIYCLTTASEPLVPAHPLLAAAPISGSTSVLRGDDAFSWDAAVVNYACPSPGCDNRLDLQMRPVVDIPKGRVVTVSGVWNATDVGSIVESSHAQAPLVEWGWNGTARTVKLTLRDDLTAKCGLRVSLRFTTPSSSIETSVASPPPPLSIATSAFSDLEPWPMTCGYCPADSSSPPWFPLLSSATLPPVAGSSTYLPILFTNTDPASENATRIVITPPNGTYSEGEVLALRSLTHHVPDETDVTVSNGQIRVPLTAVLPRGSAAALSVPYVPMPCPTNQSGGPQTGGGTVSLEGNNLFESPVYTLQKGGFRCGVPKGFPLAEASEETDIAGADNLLMFRLMANVALVAGEVITIGPLAATSSGSQPVSISSFGGDAQVNTPPLDAASAVIGPDGYLRVTVSSTIRKYVVFGLEVQTRNPGQGQFNASLSNSSGLTPTISSSSSTSLPTKISTTPEEGLLSGSRPLGLTIANITESTSVMGALNNVTITLRPNHPLPGGSSITVTGLVGSGSASSASMLVSGSLSSQIINVTWDKGTGTLVVVTCETCAVPSCSSSTLSITLKNSFNNQVGATQASISVNGTWPTNNVAFAVPPVPLTGATVLRSLTQATFTTRRIFESNSVAGALTTITVVIRPNADLWEGTTIIISGLTGSPTANTAELPLGGAGASLFLRTQAAWAKCSGSLSVEVAEGKQVPSDVDTVITFELRNRPAYQTPVIPRIGSTGSDPITAIGIFERAMKGSVLSARDQPAFKTTVTTESNTIQNKPNTLTFYLRPNFVLQGGSTITIKGLKSSQTPTTDRLALYGDSALDFTNGITNGFATWDIDTQTIILEVSPGSRLEEGCSTVVSLDLINSAQCQDPLKLSFAAQMPGTDGSDPLVIPSTIGQGLVFSACTQGIFKTALIGESQAVLGSFNILTVTILPNIDIPSNSNITISGLKGTSMPSSDISYIDWCRVAWEPDTCTFSQDPRTSLGGRISVRDPVSLAGPGASIFAIECIWTPYEMVKPRPQCYWDSTSLATFDACGGVVVLRNRLVIPSSAATVFSFAILNPSQITSPKFPIITTQLIPPTKLGGTGVLSGGLGKGVWERTTIAGSGQVVNGLSSITLVFRTNVILPVGQQITVGSLTGSGTPPATIAISGSGGFLFGGTGQWDAESLVLTATALIPGQQDIEVRFSLHGPASLSSGASPTIRSSSSPVLPTQTLDLSSPVLSATSFPRFDQASLQEATSVPGADSLLTLAIATNVAVQEGVVFTVSGLKGTQTEQGTIQLTGADAGSFRDATFDPCAGSLVFEAAHPLPLRRISFSFVLVNSAAAQSSIQRGSILISAQGQATSSSPPFTISPSSITNSVLLAEGHAHFATRIIAEGSNVFGAQNLITITLRPSELLERGSIITVSGIPPTAITPESKTVVPLGGPSSGKFCERSAEFVVHGPDGEGSIIMRICEPLSNLVDSVVTFLLENPASPTNGGHLRIEAEGTRGLVVRRSSLMSNTGGALLTGSSQPTWIDCRITEESSVAGARSVVTLNISSNLRLPPGERITITGLENASPIPEDSPRLLGGPSRIHFLEGSGMGLSPTCSEPVVITVGPGGLERSPHSISIPVLNPPHSIPPRPSPSVSSAILGTLVCGVASPILTGRESPSWKVLRLSSSTAVTGAYNALTLQITPAAALSEGTRILLSGLVGFSVDKTGQIPITGPASTLFDGPSVQWNAESGMLLFTVAVGERVPPAGITEVTFSLRNCDMSLKQPCSSPPRGGGWNVGISTSGGYQNGTTDIPYSLMSVSGGLAGGWISPAFTVAAVAVEDGGRVNGLPSSMTVQVVANAPMPEMTMITIGGLTAFASPSGPVEIRHMTPPIFLNASKFDGCTGTLTFTMPSGAPSAFSFSFTLVNSPIPLSPPPSFISASSPSGFTIPSSPLEITSSNGVRLTGLGGGGILPRFVVRTASEEAMVPCSVNQISLQLRPSYALQTGTVITVSGLTGAVIDGAEITVGGQGASLITGSAGSWIEIGGVVRMTLSASLSSTEVTTFTLVTRNPQASQPGLSPIISTDSIPPQVMMDAAGAPASILSASEGPHIIVPLRLSPFSISQLDLAARNIILQGIASAIANPAVSASDIFIDSVVQTQERRRSSTTAVIMQLRVTAHPSMLQSIADTLSAASVIASLPSLFAAEGVLSSATLTASLTAAISVSPLESFAVTASESTQVQGSLNAVTLTMTITAKVPVGATLLVSEIPPNQSPSDLLMLAGDGSNYFSYSKETPLAGTGFWYEAGRTIIHYVVRDIPPGTITVTFALRNNAASQTAEPMSVYILDGVVVHGPASPPASTLNAGQTWLFNKALLVEGTRSQGVNNPISAQFMANGPLPLGSVLTISGLMGSSTPSSTALPLFGPHAYVFNSTGVWDAGEGKLTVAVVTGEAITCGTARCTNDIGINGGQLISFDFRLINPKGASSSSALIPRVQSQAKWFRGAMMDSQTISCSYLWCGVTQYAAYLEKRNSECSAAQCFNIGLFGVDLSPPQFPNPPNITNATSSNITFNLQPSEASRAICLATQNRDPDPTLDDVLRLGTSLTDVWPSCALSGACNLTGLKFAPVLHANSQSWVTLADLAPNMLHKIFCYAEDLEAPPNAQGFEQVKGYKFLFATDIADSAAAREIAAASPPFITLMAAFSCLISAWQ